MSTADQTIILSPPSIGPARLEGVSTASILPSVSSIESFLLGGLLTTLVWMRATARRRTSARARARAARRAKREFLTNMSHEVRTPLTAILGFAELLREDGGALAPAQRRQTIDTITQAGTHLLTIVNNVLDLSKIEADRLTVERIDTPLVSILREVENLMRPRAADSRVTLRASLASAVPERAFSDPTRLRQILVNLVGNAVKFTEVGSVQIVARVEPRSGAQRLIIDIDDSGPGLTPDQARGLFTAFVQADSTVTRKHGGTGLGLTISAQLARLMGGRVTLARTEPGKGSSFRLDLPLEPVPGSPLVNTIPEPASDEPTRDGLRTATAESAGGLSGRILLAEDSPDNQRLIAFHLTRAGAEVDIARDGQVALDMIEHAAEAGTPYDLLLTDMQMPEMDGYSLARALRARGNPLAVVALTAHALEDDRGRCTAAGCDDYATKPIDRPTLVALCQRWIRRPGDYRRRDHHADAA